MITMARCALTAPGSHQAPAAMTADQGDGEKTVDYQYDHHGKPAFACHLLHVAGGCPVGLTNGAILDKIE